MAWFYAAVKRKISHNFTKGGMIRPLHGLVLHIEEGTEAGTRAWFNMTVQERQKAFDDDWEKGGKKGPHLKAYASSAHFGNPKSGALEQFVDTDDQAWAQGAGNQLWISVENEGYSGNTLTPSQVDNLASLMVWLNQTEQVPLQLADNPAGFGLGYHAMGGVAWGDHQDCPGDPIIAQRLKIIDHANEIIKFLATPPDAISGAG
jgi:hypothetical protein